MDKLDLIVDKIDDLKNNHKERLDRIDANLAEHMRRTDILEDLHRDNMAKIEQNESSIKSLEKRTVVALAKDASKFILALSATVLAVIKLIDMVIG